MQALENVVEDSIHPSRSHAELCWCAGVFQAVGRNLRIPDVPRLPAKDGPGDGVFLRLMALPKGRGMLTRALRLLYAPPSLVESVPGAPRPPLSRCEPSQEHGLCGVH